MSDADHLNRTSEDRYSYGYYPIGPRIASGALALVGTMGLLLIMVPRASPLMLTAWICGLLFFCLVMYARMMRIQSDIVLTREGFRRAFPTREWINISWPSIERVTVKRVYGAGYQAGMTIYLFAMKSNPASGKNQPATIKVLGYMTRKEAFNETLLSYLRVNKVTVVDFAMKP